LFEACFEGVHLVGEDGIIFCERVPNNDPVKHAQSAGEQQGRSQREKQD
jgi:hypothetical protein